MASKRRRFYENLFTPLVIAVSLMAISAFGIVPVRDFHLHYLGVAAGLFGGYVSLILFRWPSKFRVLRVVSFVVSPVAVVFLMPFSRSFAIGYFIGGGVSMCLLYLFEELLKRQLANDTKGK